MVIGDNNVIAKVTETAKAFFTTCETGKGWEACKGYCTSDATFSAQAEPLAEIKTLRDYTEWMKGLLATLTDGNIRLKVFCHGCGAKQCECLCGVHGNAFGEWTLSTDRKKGGHRLRVCHAVQG